MHRITCPYCQSKRAEGEFSYRGEAFIERSQTPERLSDEMWGDYIFFRDNLKGEIWEQWVHTLGCRRFFLVKRSTITHQIIKISRWGEGGDQ